MAFGQEADRTVVSKATSAPAANSLFAKYLMEVGATADVSKSYGQQAAAITKVLSANAERNAVLIDNTGYARDLVLQSVAARLTSKGGKRLYRVNWNALFTLAKDEAAFDRELKGILAYLEANKATTTIYLDDIASFSSETPVLGAKVSQILYAALSQGKIQILSAADADTFERQIAGDKRLRSRFEKIEIAKDDDQGLSVTSFLPI
ncbi:MAG: hypothetical protein IPG58_08205 [Acidobacteria bacterium]|nr:hypothetical protein [Acidobacteriota bacterium]